MQNINLPQLVIAAPSSGSGKTTVCRALMAALVRRGLTVQPYKCGPDYIDTKFHSAVCSRPSVNLDSFMASSAHVRYLYQRYAQGADVCVVEGMMGLFDGYHRDRGSTSEIASLLHLPVVLVVDARSAAFSMAALLYGFLHFREAVPLAGVIFNQVSSVRHYEMLQDSCAEVGLPCFGYLPKDASLEQQSRYLGLDFSQEAGCAAVSAWADQLERHVNLSLLLETVKRPLPLLPASPQPASSRSFHTVILRSAESFSFIYAEHLDKLHRAGRVTYLNPEEADSLPSDTDLLYLPGGYPEKHAAQLSASLSFQKAVVSYIEQGGRALAECGGMIYLSQGIWMDDEPVFVPMCGVLPFAISNQKQHRKLSLGYREFSYSGQLLRGHEFHYTQFCTRDGSSLPPSLAQVFNARGEKVSTPVFRYKNLIASYTHLYWGEIDIWKLFDE